MDKPYVIPGYPGICRCCFNPILTGEEMRFRPNGLLFHQKCVRDYPHSHYVKLEMRRVARQKKRPNASPPTKARCTEPQTTDEAVNIFSIP